MSPRLRYALDMIRDNAFSHAEPGVFTPIWDVLLTHGDHYMHLADLSAYAQAQEKVGDLYRNPRLGRGRRSSMSATPESSPATAPSRSTPPTSGG